MLRAYAQLLRLPNVFTAWADVLMGWFIAFGPLEPFLRSDPPYYSPGLVRLTQVSLLMLGASTCLYWSGMVWNDFFDAEEDRRDRPHRPIPSGRVSRRIAGWLAAALMLLGVGLAVLFALAGMDWQPVAIAASLAVCILLYDAWLKRTPIGPVAMGTCRFLNVLLGVVAGFHDSFDTIFLSVAGIVGLYIVGITWFARKEAEISSRVGLIGGAITILAAILSAALIPWSYHIWFRSWRETSTLATPERLMFYLPLLAFFAVGIGWGLERAIQNPIPALVQAAVKRCLLGIIALDAILAALFVGWPGLLILLLLPPAIILGKWVYST